MLTTRRFLQRPWALIPLGVLALVLLLSQTLGLLHGIVHAPSMATGPTAQVAHVPNAAEVVAEPAPGADPYFSRLFRGHSNQDGDPACCLYDQSSHFDALPGVPVLALPLVLPPFVFSVLLGLAVARWHALFQARGPPSVR